MKRAVGCAVVTAMALSACSASSSAEVPDELLDVVVGLYSPPPELEYAEAIIRRQCLQDAGFTPPPPTLSTDEYSDTYLALVGVFHSEDDARNHGYHSTRRGGSSLSEYEATLTESERTRFQRLLLGPVDGPTVSMRGSSGISRSRPTEGCYAEGRRAVYGSVKVSLQGAVLRSDVTGLDDDPAGLTFVDGWNYGACMSEAGYVVNGFNAFEVAGEKFGVYREPGEAPSVEEAAMAVADFRCQDELGLISRLREHYVDVAGEWVLANEERILDWRDTVNESLDRAKAIIDG